MSCISGKSQFRWREKEGKGTCCPEQDSESLLKKATWECIFVFEKKRFILAQLSVNLFVHLRVEMNTSFLEVV